MTDLKALASGVTAETVIARMKRFLDSNSKAKYWIVSILQAMLVLRKTAEYKGLSLTYAIGAAVKAVRECDGGTADEYEASRSVDLSMVFQELSDDAVLNLASELKKLRDKFGLKGESLEVFLRENLNIKTGFLGESSLNQYDPVGYGMTNMFLHAAISRYPTFELEIGDVTIEEVVNKAAEYYQGLGYKAVPVNDGVWGMSLDISKKGKDKFSVLFTSAGLMSAVGRVIVNVKGE